MTTLQFAADTVDIQRASAATDVDCVIVANPATEQVVMFQRAVGGASYIERDDQSFGTHEGVATITLSKMAIRVTLNAAGQRALKCDALTIALELADDDLEPLRAGLVAIFAEQLEVDAAWTAT